MTEDDDEKRPRGGPRFDWTRISVAALAVVAITAGVQLITVTVDGTTAAGFGLFILGATLAGAWIAYRHPDD